MDAAEQTTDDSRTPRLVKSSHDYYVNYNLTEQWIRPEFHGQVVICNGGRVLVPPGLRADPVVDSMIDNISQHMEGYDRTVPVPLEEVQQLWRKGGVAEHNARRGDAGNDTIKTARRLLESAAAKRASDIQILIHTMRNLGVVKFRINGDYVKQPEWQMVADKADDLLGVIYNVMCSAGGSNYNRTQHQSGRISRSSGHLPYSVQNVRVQASPKLGGQIMALRLQYEDESPGTTVTEKLSYRGFSPAQCEALERFSKSNEGLILVTGPTGSGKTTTLFSIIDGIVLTDDTLNVMTAEDPPEYENEEVVQLLIPHATSAAEREANNIETIMALLREDPDVILIGEVRNEEGARLAMQAATTGHLTWTTVHTNSAIEALDRLSDIAPIDQKALVFNPGVVKVLVAQRLCKQLCKNCAVSYSEVRETLPESVQRRIEAALADCLDKIRFPGEGCEECRGNHNPGFMRDRTAIVEVIVTDLELLEKAREEGTTAARQYWLAKGGITMMRHGLEKIAAGEVDPLSLETALGTQLAANV